jgi:glutamine synthetase
MSYNCNSPEDVLRTIKDDKIEMIDLRFTDLPGLWQHFSVPPSALDLDSIAEGVGFDGSSIRGFQEIQESDMLVIPDPTTAFPGPVRRSANAGVDLQHPRSDHGTEL